jgi:rubrerythrin
VDDEREVDPFADGVLTPEELRADTVEQPYECASCGLGFGDDSEATCPACGADLTVPGALVRTDG